MTRPTCCLCGWRDSEDLTDLDGRTVPACATCTEPPRVSPDWYYEPAPRGSTSGDAVLSALRGLGEATTGEIASALGADDCTSREYDAIAASLRRLKKHGRVLVEGGVYSVNPHPPVRQRRTGTAEERSAAIRAGWATRRQRQNDTNRKAA